MSSAVDLQRPRSGYFKARFGAARCELDDASDPTRKVYPNSKCSGQCAATPAPTPGTRCESNCECNHQNLRDLAQWSDHGMTHFAKDDNEQFCYYFAVCGAIEQHEVPVGCADDVVPLDEIAAVRYKCRVSLQQIAVPDLTAATNSCVGLPQDDAECEVIGTVSKMRWAEDADSDTEIIYGHNEVRCLQPEWENRPADLSSGTVPSRATRSYLLLVLWTQTNECERTLTVTLAKPNASFAPEYNPRDFVTDQCPDGKEGCQPECGWKVQWDALGKPSPAPGPTDDQPHGKTSKHPLILFTVIGIVVAAVLVCHLPLCVAGSQSASHFRPLALAGALYRPSSLACVEAIAFDFAHLSNVWRPCTCMSCVRWHMSRAWFLL